MALLELRSRRNRERTVCQRSRYTYEPAVDHSHPGTVATGLPETIITCNPQAPLEHPNRSKI
eukprot:5082821-Amphidinium_carterae.1